MKKLAILSMLALATLSHAALETGGTIGNPLVDRDSTTKKLVLTTRIVDSNGNTTGSMGAVSITSMPSYTPIGMLAYTAASQTAQTLNLTSTAGASVPCIVCLSSNGGPAAGFKVQFTTSATAPVVLTSTSQGHYIAASTTAQCWGPFAAGVHLHAAGVAAASSILVDIQKVQ